MTSDDKAPMALKLRQAGASYEAIAVRLDYPNADAARDAVIDELERVTRDVDAVAAQINVQQLDALLLSLWSEARAGNPRSVDQVLRILDRRERLEEKLKSLPVQRTKEKEGLEEGEEGSERPKRMMPFGGGKNVPGSTQSGDARPEEVKRAISRAQMGNLNAWKTGSTSRFIPSLHCNGCEVASQCHYYFQDSVCTVPEAFRTMAEELGDASPDTIIVALKRKLMMDLERLEMGRAAEYAAGGKLSREVTSLSNRVEKSMKLLMALYGRYDEVGGRQIVNVTQQNLIVGGEVARTALVLLRLPPDKRGQFLEQWQGSIETQKEILEEAGIDMTGLRGFGGVASSDHVLAQLSEALSSPPDVEGSPPGSVEGRGSDVIEGDWSEVERGEE